MDSYTELRYFLLAIYMVGSNQRCSERLFVLNSKLANDMTPGENNTASLIPQPFTAKTKHDFRISGTYFGVADGTYAGLVRAHG
jgi:hypothetical protein